MPDGAFHGSFPAQASTWDLFEGPPVRKERWSSARPGVIKVKDGVPSNRKRGLWLLPFDRVVFFDVDNVPLPGPSLKRKLDALFAGLDGAGHFALLARRDERSARRCFNSGMMALRPGRAAYAAYDAASLDAAALRRDAGPGGLCPGHDQPILNHAFPDWVAVDDGGWATSTPGRANRDCGANVAGESYHFFLNSAPWCAELPEGCDPADLGTCGAGGPCRGHAAAVRAWWAALDGLPEPARGLCRAALPASAPPACAGGG